VSTYLLDVNVLLALSDPLHVHHQAAHHWFAKASESWATCAITENGLVRVASHPRYPNSPGNATVVLEMLREFCALASHNFWDQSVSLRHWLSPRVVVSHAQVTDLYLLALSVHHHGKLATFDQQIPARLVRGGVQALEVIAP
jgi:uncharacterized protein